MIDSRTWLKSASALLFCVASAARADDGHRLWLRYELAAPEPRSRYAANATEIVSDGGGSVARAAVAESEHALSGLLGRRTPVRAQVDQDGAIIVALANSPELQALHLKLHGLGNEGFLIRTARLNAHRVTVIAANGEPGLLYGTFQLLRRMEAGEPLEHLDIRDRPLLPLRVLDHWDNLDRTVERGYAGKSLWDWQRLPDASDPRYVDYARANASVGINGTVLNNVNADPKMLSAAYLQKAAALANVFRTYGIHVYLSVRFSSPIEIGGLKTADPFNPDVQAWWRLKADEIYRLIPDFGGFVVKANSEGQPGPQDYNRTHSDGANVIADALKPHGGTVFWRAFVYGASAKDRALQAFDEFRPLDGKFRDNVIVQVKNGPIDFQPREPFHPLFGQMPHTRIAFETQITREYLGQNTGVVFLAPMWTEALRADTCAPKCGTPVVATISAMAGVSNVGDEPNWTGTIFDQANWYAFGRLAWNPRLSAQSIAEEWTRLTWSNKPQVVQPITTMMMGSREAVVDFMTPLGLAHQMATDYHYGPAPWVCDLKQPSWNPCYYSKADRHGIGFNRVAASRGGDQSGKAQPVVEAYMQPLATRFADPMTVPEKYLLWFHHLPWTFRMRSGRTLWDELVEHYDRGISEVAMMSRTWARVRPYVDQERWSEVKSDIEREKVEARWWRDASIAYFQSVSKLPIRPGIKKPAHPLQYYEALRPPHLPGQQ